MKLIPLGKNVNQLTLKDGTAILFSYATAVAMRVPTLHGVFVTDLHWSQTTAKHISEWTRGLTVHKVPQAQLDRAVRRA